MKNILVGCFSGCRTQNVWISSAQDVCDFWGKSLWLKTCMIKVGRPCPLNYSTIFVVQRRKNTKNSVNAPEWLRGHLLCLLGFPLWDSFGCPAEHQPTTFARGELQSALGQPKCLQTCHAKVFLASANLSLKF
jgi:hypothetical protein